MYSFNKFFDCSKKICGGALSASFYRNIVGTSSVPGTRVRSSAAPETKPGAWTESRLPLAVLCWIGLFSSVRKNTGGADASAPHFGDSGSCFANFVIKSRSTKRL